MIAGKGYWIWKIWTTEGGRTQRIAEMAKEANFTHVLFKITDGTSRYNIIDDLDYAKNLVNDLHKLGIQAWGWGYTYGYDPRKDAIAANNRCRELGVDGFVIDAESEYKQQGGNLKALQYMDSLDLDIPVALSSYRFPSYHPQFPFGVFMKKCDFAMPQVYWEGSHNPGVQLKKCLDEYAQFNKPIIPAGSAYKRGDWESTPEDVTKFLKVSEEEELSGANFWVWQHTRYYLPETWEAIVNYQWSGEIPEPPEPPINGGITVDTIEQLDEVIEHLDEKGKPYVININYDINKLTVLIPDDGNGEEPGNGGSEPPEPPAPDGEWATVTNYEYEVELPSGDEEERVRECIVYKFVGWKQEPGSNPNKPLGVPFLEKAKKGNSVWKLSPGTRVFVNAGQNFSIDADVGFWHNYGREWLNHEQDASERYFLDKGNLNIGL